MKKFIKSLMAVIIGCTTIFFSSLEVRAEAVKYIKADTIFTSMSYNVNGHLANIGYMSLDNELVYCIEPLKLVLHGTSMVPAGDLSESQKSQISLIAYFGYGGNQTSEKWYAATQIMIWESLGYNGQLTGFDDYQNYKKQINDQINTYKKNISFNNHSYTIKENESITLDDTNSVLNTFKQIDYDKNLLTVSKKDNKLTIKALSKQVKDTKITLKKKLDNELGVPVVYRGSNDPNVQEVISPKLNTNTSATIKVSIQEFGKLKFYKKGNALTSTSLVESEYGDIHTLNYAIQPLKNVKANIYALKDIKDINGNLIYAKDSLVEELVSDSNGVTSQDLYPGEYCLKEIKSLDGYVKDDKAYEFTISPNETSVELKELTLNNELSKVNLHLAKKFEAHPYNPIIDAFKDVKFGIYTNQDIFSYDGVKLVDKDGLLEVCSIDENGNLISNIDLPIGTYYIKELQTHQDYELDSNTYYFEVKSNNQVTNDIYINSGLIENKLKRSKLSVFKVDGHSGKPLQATFALYNSNHEIIDEFTTDKNGEAVIDNLVNAVYYLQEIKAPKDYLLNPKLIKLEISGHDLAYTMDNVKEPIGENDKPNSSKKVTKTNDTSNTRLPLSLMALSLSSIYALIIAKLVRK